VPALVRHGLAPSVKCLHGACLPACIPARQLQQLLNPCRHTCLNPCLTPAGATLPLPAPPALQGAAQPAGAGGSRQLHSEWHCRL
jgi:hypothetical protein